MLTNIPIDGYPKGITLYTIAPPSLEHMRDAVALFHDFPLLNDSPFVVLGNPSDFPLEDRIALNRLGIPGYEHVDEKGNFPLDDQH